jgi:hypothetical protein
LFVTHHGIELTLLGATVGDITAADDILLISSS